MTCSLTTSRFAPKLWTKGAHFWVTIMTDSGGELQMSIRPRRSSHGRGLFQLWEPLVPGMCFLWLVHGSRRPSLVSVLTWRPLREAAAVNRSVGGRNIYCRDRPTLRPAACRTRAAGAPDAHDHAPPGVKGICSRG